MITVGIFSFRAVSMTRPWCQKIDGDVVLGGFVLDADRGVLPEFVDQRLGDISKMQRLGWSRKRTELGFDFSLADLPGGPGGIGRAVFRSTGSFTR